MIKILFIRGDENFEILRNAMYDSPFIKGMLNKPKASTVRLVKHYIRPKGFDLTFRKSADNTLEVRFLMFKNEAAHAWFKLKWQ